MAATTHTPTHTHTQMLSILKRRNIYPREPPSYMDGGMDTHHTTTHASVGHAVGKTGQHAAYMLALCGLHTQDRDKTLRNVV